MSPRPLAGGWLWRPLIGAALSQIVLGMARPTASYAALVMGADAAVIGVVTAAFAILPMIGALPIGALAGRVRRIGAVPAWGAAVSVAGCLLAAVAESVGILLAGCALIGLGNLAVLLGAQAWITRSAPPARYNDGFGWMTAAMALGQALGPLLAGVLIGADAPTLGATSASFLGACGAALLMVVAFLSMATRAAPAGGRSQARAAAVLRTPGVLRYVVISAAVLTSVDIVTAYLPLMAADAGISPIAVGAMLATRGVASMSSRLLLGPLGRLFGQPALLIASCIGTAGCLAVMVLVPEQPVLFAGLALAGFFLGMGQPLTMTAVALALPEAARSSGLAVRLLGNRVAQTATPLLAGALAGVFGPASALAVQVVGLALSGLWEAAVRRRKPGGGDVRWGAPPGG